jgi:phytoene dehydrogenase-like protein
LRRTPSSARAAGDKRGRGEHREHRHSLNRCAAYLCQTPHKLANFIPAVALCLWADATGRVASVGGLNDYDAVIVGAGPNGLAAAVTLARAGWAVLVREAEETIGGATRSAELTLPGFVHDVCSAFHPLGAASSAFRDLPLADHGLEFVHPPAPLAHPLDGGRAVVLERALDETASSLGRDGAEYRRLISPFAERWPDLERDLLRPLVRVPRHPVVAARFGLQALRPARGLAEGIFDDEPARALFAGVSAHSFLPLERATSAAVGLVLLTLGHAAGWPIVRSGSQKLADALAGYLRSLGGEIEAGAPVESLAGLPRARAVVCDLTPRQLLRVAGDRLPSRYRRALARYRYGPGTFKLDYALDGPIPWQAPGCARAGTVHVGGTLAEIAEAERAPWEGRHAERPFVLVGQQSRFDETRAPAGNHTLWAYCHVPNGSTTDMSERIERQIERFAPGFRDLVLARSVSTPADLERRNANLVGGDINGGVADLRQLLARPVARVNPYSTPVPGLYVCSAATPPGGGVHGLCGYRAAQAVLRASDGRR